MAFCFQNAGGSVMIQRVNGSLAVSRALGDFEYKNVDGKVRTVLYTDGCLAHWTWHERYHMFDDLGKTAED